MAPPAAKRPRAGARAGTDGAPSAAECATLVQRLSKESAHALLAELMASSTEAHSAVTAEVARHDAEPVDLSHYSHEASAIVCSLDGLRESQKYARTGDVASKLTKLVDECMETLSSTHAFEAMVNIMAVVSSEAEGEVRNGVLGCGGLDREIAGELTSLVEDMSAEQKASISDAVEDLESVVEELKDDGCGDGLAHVVQQIRGN